MLLGHCCRCGLGFYKVACCFDNVASTLLLVWIGLKPFADFTIDRVIAYSALYVSFRTIKSDLDGCVARNAHNTVFGSKSSAICAQVVYFLHTTRPSVT